MATPRTFTRRDVASLIAAGDSIVILHDRVLRLNGWQEKHPGGKLVIAHMVGRDASTEISMHIAGSNADTFSSHSPEVVKSMYNFRIGRIVQPWVNFVPPIQGGTFDLQDESEQVDAWDDSGYSSEGTSIYTSEEDKHEKTTKMTSAAYVDGVVQRELEADLAKYPSLDTATQREIATKFDALHQRIIAEGFYDCRGWEYGKEMIRYSMLFALFVGFLSRGWYATSACFLGLFWQQIMFTAHDAGHRGITHNITIDTLIGIFIGDLCCGLSIGWWKSSHNVHHFVTNSPEHDPDIQNVPLFSTAPQFFTSIKSSYYNGFCFWFDRFAEITTQYQQYTYYPIMAVARFNLYFLSWAHLASARSKTKGSMWWTRPTEIAAIAIYCFLYFYLLLYCSIPTWWDRAVFLLASHVATLPLHIQITLSHWGTSTADLGPAETFAQRQLRTTMDVICPTWLDFVHGGLQFQAVHHLFPRVPRHNLRALQTLVQEFCVETDIEYLCHGFAKGNGVVLSRLGEIARQAKMVASCGNDLASGKIHHH